MTRCRLCSEWTREEPCQPCRAMIRAGLLVGACTLLGMGVVIGMAVRL